MAIPGQFTTLRVRIPKTIDGINLAVGPDRQTLWDETELPLTAKPFLEKRNLELPFHLRMVIDVMNYQVAPPPETLVKGVGVELLKNESDEIAQLKAKLAEYESREKPPQKPRGKPFVKKTHENADNLL